MALKKSKRLENQGVYLLLVAEAAVSVGYEHLRYKKFESPEECAPQVGERSHNYWGPTKLSASIIYIF